MKKALYPLTVEDPDCGFEKGFRRTDTFLVNGPAPTEIVRQVAGSDTVKWTQPFVKPAVVAVHVLTVPFSAVSTCAHCWLDSKPI